ncbi:MAG: Ldh family oxidoreductase [Lautropia sp.]
MTAPGQAADRRPIGLVALSTFIRAVAVAGGMSPANAERICDVYVRATLRGVGHHDVHDLPERVASWRSGAINPDPDIRKLGGEAALEGYDGDNGAGELCASFVLDRAGELARRYGIGLCTIRHSNHFLSAAPYAERAAEQGLLSIVLSRSKPVMGMPGYGRRLIGNSPLGFATLAGDAHPLLLDICLAYSSFGNLKDLAEAGRTIPPSWGGDDAGRPTVDPSVITSSGVSYPIGEHKGFGLGLLVEILTGGLAQGAVADATNSDHPDGNGVHSQTAIAIRPDALMPAEAYRAKVSELVDRVERAAPGIRMPGASSFAKKQRSLGLRTVELRPAFFEQANRLARELGVAELH